MSISKILDCKYIAFFSPCKIIAGNFSVFAILSLCPRQESNLHFRLRRAMSYPLYDEDEKSGSRASR